MTAVAFNPQTLAPAWNAFQSALPVRLAAIHSQAEYDRAVEGPATSRIERRTSPRSVLIDLHLVGPGSCGTS